MSNKHQNEQNADSSNTRHWILLAKVSLFIALSTLIMAFYTLWSNYHFQSRLSDKNYPLAIRVEKLTHEQHENQSQIAEKMKLIETNREELQAKLDKLNDQMHTTINQPPQLAQNQYWVLLKARYYLELANINVHWSKSFSVTIALLQQADQVLKEFNDPKIFEIRQLIAKDITQLQKLPDVDYAGVLSQLDAAQDSVKTLTILPKFNTENAPEKPIEYPTSPWRLRLEYSVNLLSKLVIVRRNDENIKPLISPAFEAIVKENIHLNLQEAQWAVLNDSPMVYQLVLNQAIKLLKTNFNVGAADTAALIKKLTELQKLQIAQTKPTLSPSLKLLDQFIEAKAPALDPLIHHEQGAKSK